jgi:hypothetical protein
MLTILFLAVLVGYIFIPFSQPLRYLAALLIVVLFNAMMYPSVSRNYQLENEGAHTAGVLLEKDCAAGAAARVKYRFAAGGKDWVGEGRPGQGNPACDALKPGDQVFVTYLPSAPGVNVPERAVDSWMKLGWLFSALLVFVLAWMNRKQAQLRQRQRGGATAEG